MKKLLCMVALVAISIASFAQTAEELKAEREALKAELTSKDGKKLEKALDKLLQTEAPAATSVASVDALVSLNVSLLSTLVATENILSEYKTEITQTKDGEVDINKYSAKLDDYVAQLPLLVAAAASAAEAAQQISKVKDDVANLDPAQALPAAKAVKWAGNATDVNVKMIERETKLLQNLINSCKAAKNL